MKRSESFGVHGQLGTVASPGEVGPQYGTRVFFGEGKWGSLGNNPTTTTTQPQPTTHSLKFRFVCFVLLRFRDVMGRSGGRLRVVGWATSTSDTPDRYRIKSNRPDSKGG